MALRAMYKGIKKVLAPLIINRPGELAIDQDALNTELNTVFFPRSEQAVLGASNFFDKTKGVATRSTCTQTTDGFNVTVSSQTWSSVYFDFTNLPKSTDLILSDYAEITTAGNFVRLQVSGSANGTDWTPIANTSDITTSQARSLTFNTGTYTYIRVFYYLTGATSGSADVTFKTPAITYDGTYAPYAMTNKELTDAMQEPELSNVDVNTLVEPKRYHLVSNITNLPSGVTTGVLDVIKITSAGVPKKQILWPSGNPTNFYIRDMYSGGTWSAWVEFSGTVMS